jgi:hypothetical protein
MRLAVVPSYGATHRCPHGGLGHRILSLKKIKKKNCLDGAGDSRAPKEQRAKIVCTRKAVHGGLGHRILSLKKKIKKNCLDGAGDSRAPKEQRAKIVCTRKAV